MKLKKMIVPSIVMALAACILFTGCSGEMLAEIFAVVEKYATSSGASESEAPESEAEQSEASSGPSAASSLPAASSSESSSSTSAQTPAVSLALNYAYLDLAKGDNAHLKASVGPDALCSVQIAFGGTPVVAYQDNTSDIWLTVQLDGSNYDAMMSAWEGATRSGPYDMPEYNCFPDDFKVEKVYLGGTGRFLEPLFAGAAERSIENISLCLGQTPREELLPAVTGENEEIGYDIDLTLYTYEVDGCTLQIAYPAGVANPAAHHVLIEANT